MDSKPHPVAGQGATILDNGSECPATIIRVAFDGIAIWLQIDRVEEGPSGEARFVPDPTAWIHRAVCRHGVYRTDPDMMPVDVGRRRYRHYSPGLTGLEQLRDRFERLEPWLLKRRWYPMTYMAIPSVLASADELIAEMDSYHGPEAEAVRELRHKLAVRRDGFKRVV